MQNTICVVRRSFCLFKVPDEMCCHWHSGSHIWFLMGQRKKWNEHARLLDTCNFESSADWLVALNDFHPLAHRVCRCCKCIHSTANIHPCHTSILLLNPVPQAASLALTVVFSHLSRIKSNIVCVCLVGQESPSVFLASFPAINFWGLIFQLSEYFSLAAVFRLWLCSTTVPLVSGLGLALPARYACFLHAEIKAEQTLCCFLSQL